MAIIRVILFLNIVQEDPECTDSIAVIRARIAGRLDKTDQAPLPRSISPAAAAKSSGVILARSSAVSRETLPVRFQRAFLIASRRNSNEHTQNKKVRLFLNEHHVVAGKSGSIL